MHRHGLSRPDRARPHAGRQGRRGLGGRLYRTGRDPLDLRDHALHRAPALGRPRHPDARQDGGPHPRARRARRVGALLQRPARPQLLFARSADGANRARDRELHLRTPPGAHHGQGGHPQRPPLAQGGGASRQAGGLRPDLCVCRPRAELPASLPLQGVQSPHRRIRRLARKPRAAPQGAPDRHQGSGGRQLRRSLPPLDGRASRRGRAGEGRDRGYDRSRRGDSGPLGRLPRRLGERQPLVPLRRGGRAGTLHRRRQEAHHEAGGRRRPL